MAKKSETLAQREKAQRDLIELKKMRSGEMDPGPKPSEEEKIPMTFKQKIVNFFYHYKIAVIICSFLIIVGTILTVDIIKRPKYDSKIVTFSYDPVYRAYSGQIADYFEGLYSDVNGNGKVEIANIDCCYAEKEQQTKTAALCRLHSTVSAEADALIFIMDEESIRHFDNLDTDLFDEADIVMMPQSFYDAIEKEEGAVFATKLFAVMRRVDDTLIDGKNSDAIIAAKKVMLKLKEEWAKETAEEVIVLQKIADEAERLASEAEKEAKIAEAEKTEEEAVAARRAADDAAAAAERARTQLTEAKEIAKAAQEAFEKAEAE